MLKTYLYIPEQLNQLIITAVKVQKKSKAEVIRQALEKGLKEDIREGHAGVDALFKIAEIGKKYKLKGPKDSSARMDEYLWDKDWSIE